MRLRIGLLIMLALSIQTALQATDVSGNVSGVWDMPGSPYMVNGDITVVTGQTLTIQPGVQVLFTGHYKFIVNGNLQAIGTQQDSILFTRAYPTEASKWWGIRFIQAVQQSRMDFCIVEYGHATGGDNDGRGGGVYCNQSSPSISHCSIRSNQADVHGGGMYLYHTSAPHVSYCVLSNNRSEPYQGGGVYCDLCAPVFDHCLMLDNYATGRGGAIFFDNSTGGVWSCTFARNSSTQVPSTICIMYSAPVVNSSIVALGTGVGVDFMTESASVQMVYCDFFGNSAGDFGENVPAGLGVKVMNNSNGDSCDANHNIFLDPLFVNAPNSDYHLAPGSHCIDAGDPSLPHDPDGSVADIGAFTGLPPHGIHLVVPNGGDSWPIGQADTIRWSGSGFTGNVRLELNRNYPSGGWETIAANTGNNGSEPWIVTGPSSSHCRIRVSTVSDTLSDVSDADFSITANLSLVAPNGGEDWGVFQTDTVRWSGGGFNAVRIELNRNYPSGTWEVLRDTTANDGVEPVFVTDPLSTHCRVRISAIGDTLTAVSAGDFSITASQGYLALVRSNAQSVPVLNWTPAIIECPQVASEYFHLKNFGSEAIVVFQPPEPPSVEFSRTTTCGSFLALSPSQMSACSLRLTFDPLSDGTYRDTLLIQTDAVNGVNGYVRIPLSGTQISTPAVPQVVITIAGNDARLNWNRITQSIGGCPVTVTGYEVFYSPTFGGPYYYHGFATDTSYTHVRAVQFAGGMFYQVVAYTGALDMLAHVPQGMLREDVERTLREQ